MTPFKKGKICLNILVANSCCYVCENVYYRKIDSFFFIFSLFVQFIYFLPVLVIQKKKISLLVLKRRAFEHSLFLIQYVLDITLSCKI